MRILFLHGWTSVPGGRKPTFFQGSGHEVINPALPADSFDESVHIAAAEYNQHRQGLRMDRVREIAETSLHQK